MQVRSYRLRAPPPPPLLWLLPMLPDELREEMRDAPRGERVLLTLLVVGVEVSRWKEERVEPLS